MVNAPVSHVKVLAVDDDPLLLATIEEWLGLEGYDVRTASDGQEAADLARWEPFDVVVTDLRMPNLDGLALLSRLEALAPDVRVIFLSGEATKADVIEALREGRSFDFLEKPLADMAMLTRSIERAIAKRPVSRQVTLLAAPVSHPVLEAVFDYLRAHLAAPLGLKQVADAMGYSPSYLTAMVREATGQPVMQWVTSMRLEEACQLLGETDATVAEVAIAVGIADPKYFSRLFKRAYGVPPQIWRSRLR